MEELKIQELYTLAETIAAELFEGVVYPWEALPEIGAFIVKLGIVCPRMCKKKGEKMCGWQRALRFFRARLFMGRLLLMKGRKSGIALLSGGMR